jgi:subtilisin-like proprotein convertase family protein
LPPTAITQIKALMDEKAARTPAQRKIASQLLYAKSGRFVAPKPRGLHKGGDEAPPAADEETNLLEIDAEGRVLVDIKGDLDAGLARQIETLQGSVVSTSEAHKSARAWMPMANLESLASLNYVRAVRPALQAQTNRAKNPALPASKGGDSRLYQAHLARIEKQLAQAFEAPGDGANESATTFVGAQQSQGDRAHQADRARKFYNTDGTGIKVGVLSDSARFLAESIASGDIRPDAVVIPGAAGPLGSGEGTAMMEIIQDVAPGAQLFFATAFDSPESFADNIRRLRFEFDCDIIVDDVIYFFESPYQDDIIAQAVDDVTADGAMYFSSAGNQGNLSDGWSGTWEGDFKPAGTLATLPAGYTVHNFDSDGDRQINNRIEFTGGPVILHWSDPGTLDLPQSANDYDIFILDANLRNVVFASTDVQDGDDLPFEFVGFTVSTGRQVVVARNPGAATRAIRVVNFGGELAMATSGGNYGHSAAHDAIALAAVDQAQAIAGVFQGGPTTQVELFSTDGHRRVFYHPNGTRIRGGVTFASGGGEFRVKPELTAADGVATNTPGFQPFFGTSAAAPHAAGIAALMKAAVPSNNAFRIKSSMVDTAIDIEGAGHDRDSGAGIINTMAALAASGAKPAVFLERGTVTATPAGGAGSINPGGGGTLAIQLVNNGGANATAVSATLATSTPGVTVTQGASTYPDLPAGGSGANVTPYTFNVDAGVACGTVLNFTLTATYTGNGTKPVSFPATAQTGVPNPVPVVTSFAGPRAAIPDNLPAGVNVPLAVAGVGNLARMVFSIDGTTCNTTIGSTTVGLDHTWVGDLVLRLTSPGGTSVTLMSQPGGSGNSGNNFCQTVLDDSAATSIQNITVAQNPYTGTFRPASPLAAFIGQNADGVWTLNASDRATLDTGGVRAFSLRTSGFICN